jgi:transcriptional regulator with XRE-family HTH domain
MRFGERVRDLRTSKGLSQRALGSKVGVSFTHISKVENKKLDFGDYPSELLLLADKIPEQIRRRAFERPDVFRRIAALDDRALDRLIAHLDVTGRKPPSSSRRRGHNSAPK